MKIGLIGLGTMGNPIGTCLINGGHEVKVYDVNEEAVKKMCEKGAIKASTISELASDIEFCVLSLPNSKIIEDIVFQKGGLLELLKPGTIVIDASTSNPESTKKIGKAFAEKGIKMIDAPVSGGPGLAAKGQLSIMVGGEKEVIEKSMEVLKLFGSKIFVIGDLGAGHIMKIVNNLLFGATLVAGVEAIILGVKAGLDPHKMVEVIGESSGRCYAVNTKFPNIVFPRHFKPGFKTKLLHKDMDLAISLAKKLKVPLAMGNLAQQYYTAAMNNEEFAELDNTIIIKYFEQLTGVEVK
jgi:3-hydroxyisobutyrate dehydrogenase-like beta-hydroxyacid dehydrogenase